MNSTLYLFIDESGNFDFSPKGSKFFTLTGFLTFNPTVNRINLIELRYKLLSEGIDQEYFHASEDRQTVRDRVFQTLRTLTDNFEVRAIVARKNKTNPALYQETYSKKGKIIQRSTGLGLYRKLSECLLQYVFKGKEGFASKIVVVLGSIFTGEKEKVILQTLKHFLKNKFPGIPFEIYFHQSCTDLNCQLADYCCWAISVKVERGESRPYEIIKPHIKSVFDIFKDGDRDYY